MVSVNSPIVDVEVSHPHEVLHMIFCILNTSQDKEKSLEKDQVPSYMEGKETDSCLVRRGWTSRYLLPLVGQPSAT